MFASYYNVYTHPAAAINMERNTYHSDNKRLKH